MTTPTPPLWKLMRDAYHSSYPPINSECDWCNHHGYAAELRAIAEEAKTQ